MDPQRQLLTRGGGAARRTAPAAAAVAAAWPGLVLLADSAEAFGDGADQLPRLLQCLFSGWWVALVAGVAAPWVAGGRPDGPAGGAR